MGLTFKLKKKAHLQSLQVQRTMNMNAQQWHTILEGCGHKVNLSNFPGGKMTATRLQMTCVKALKCS